MSQENVPTTSQEVNSQEMAMHFGLPPPEPLDLSGGNISENWKKFKQKFTNYEIATGINKKETATRVATLLTVIGNDAIDVFNTITWDAEGDDTKIEKVLQKFEEHCEPKKNVSYERYKFFSRAQESGETITEEEQSKLDADVKSDKSPQQLKEEVMQKYANVFTGLGRLEKPYHIEVDPTVTPVVNPPRTIPAALRDRVKTELEDMEKRGVIRRVDEPTDWVSSMAIVEKPDGSLRICLDPRHLNKAIKREHFQLPTIEDIATRMANAKWFTKLDANRGYWQIPLDEESQLLTTFNTPFGRFCYQVPPFGIKSAQEVFQKRMSQHFSDLEGVETDIDDIIVHAETEVKHDQRLHSVLERCEKMNLTLNKEKCVFKCKEVTYIGHKLTKDGIKPDDNKVRAINEMPAPSDKKGVERLLGTVNYLGKFIPNLATVTKAIRIHLRKDTEFEWSYEQDQAFQEIKAVLTKDGGSVLRFFDVRKPVRISCDASPTGLGAVLLQSGFPVAYASRSLTKAESRYAQIEKELLAVQFSLERFNQYTYGKKVAIESDHKPLEAIVKKPLAAAPPRLQRILLRMQKYDYALEYKPGKELVLPDMLSREPVSPTIDDNMEEEIALHVHLVRRTLPVTESKLEEIKRETAEDQSMSKLSETIKYGWPETKGETPVSIHACWDVRDELSELNGVVLRGERIVIPPSMRKEMLERIHQGHMGIEKSKRRARDTLYWPGMNSPNYRYSIKMHDMLRTPKAKLKGAYDSFLSTKQAMGIGSHRPFHLGQV